MPTTLAIKDLGDGQLANSKGTLYTTPASTQTIVRSIILVNTGAGANTCNLYVKRDGSNSRRIMEQDLSIASKGKQAVTEIVTLEAGDLLEGDAASASEVDYVLSGVESS